MKYMKQVITIALLSVGYVCFTGCKDLQSAAPALKSGQQFKRTVTLNSNLIMMFPNTDNKQTRMTLSFKVLTIDPQNQAAVQVTVDSLQADFLTMGRKFAFNSDTTPANPTPSADDTNKTLAEQQLKFTAAFANVKGGQWTAVVNKDGKVLELKDLSPRIKSLAYDPAKPDMIGGDQVRMLFTENNLKQYVSPVFYNGIADDPNNPGKQWRSEASIFVPYCPLITLEKSCQFNPDEKSKEKTNTLTAPVNFAMAARQPDNSPYHSGSSFAVTYCNGEGKVHFSTKTRQIFKVQETIHVGIKSQLAGQRPETDKKRPEPKIEYIVDKVIEDVLE